MSTKLKTSEIGYDIDILVQGYPGKAVCHGGLGWSTVVLIRGHGCNILVDTGGFGMRGLLQEKLDDHGLKPGNISHVLLTHSHYDHSVNWTSLKGELCYWNMPKYVKQYDFVSTLTTILYWTGRYVNLGEQRLCLNFMLRS